MLSMNKYSVSLRVLRKGQPEATGGEQAGEARGAVGSDEWSEDIRLPVDLGVVLVEHPRHVREAASMPAWAGRGRED